MITAEKPPVTPVSARAYSEAGLPWFDYYNADVADLPPSQALADVKPVGEWLGDDPDLGRVSRLERRWREMVRACRVGLC